MPDFIDNHIFVTGPATDLTTFRQSHFARDRRTGRTEFDFESFIPMPDVLREIVVDSDSDLALLALGVERSQSADRWALTLYRVLEFDWVKAAGIGSRQELLAHFQRHSPAAISAARKRISAFQETGYYDWYSWRLANWGVKWGPTSTLIVAESEGLLEFQYETPWSFPEPAFRKLGLLYPGLCFDIFATNPDLGIGIQGHVLGDEVSLEPVNASEVDGRYADRTCFNEAQIEAAST